MYILLTDCQVVSVRVQVIDKVTQALRGGNNNMKMRRKYHYR